MNRKRFHTRQSPYSQFSLNRGSARSTKSRLKSHTTVRRVGFTEIKEVVAPVEKNEPEVMDGEVILLEDEITQQELQGFTFSIIEKLASLAPEASAKGAINSVVSEKLTTYVNLVKECKSSETELRKVKAATKELEVTMDKVERLMMLQFKTTNLRKRVAELNKAIANFVAKLGEQMGFPSSLMNQFSQKLTEKFSEISGL